VNAYCDALEYLYAFTDFEASRRKEHKAARPLSRFRGLLRRLGSPQRAFPSVLVAGTKGKGSVCALLASILSEAGCRTGLYTSPHLHTFRERIQINGELISEDEVVALVDWLRPSFDRAPGPTFDAITAIAFEHFQRRDVDIAILEVGLGGRSDSTNVVRPLVSAVTLIDLDHTYILGDTLSKIAVEKAGIIKRGVPVVLAPQPEPAALVFTETARRRRARAVWVGQDWRWERESISTRGQQFTLSLPANRADEWSAPLAGLRIPLLGAHQLDNAATAVAIASELSRRGFSVREDALRRGLERVQWPARLELMQEHPWLVVDSAHTVASVRAALQTALETFGRLPDVVIFGASADKDAVAMIHTIPASVRLVLTQTSHPKAMTVEELRRTAAPERGQVQTAHSAKQALQIALSAVSEDGGVLVVGSVFLAAEVRQAWREMRGLPLPPTDPL
jgi:dihydrofolate synthase/folylpolyglutamate synthase